MASGEFSVTRSGGEGRGFKVEGWREFSGGGAFFSQPKNAVAMINPANAIRIGRGLDFRATPTSIRSGVGEANAKKPLAVGSKFWMRSSGCGTLSG